jgi:hypothetical protein
MRVFADTDAILALLIRECQMKKFNDLDSLMTIGSIQCIFLFAIENVAIGSYSIPAKGQKDHQKAGDW